MPAILQTGGPSAFRLRLVLAATLSPNYGIYSGQELCENVAQPNYARRDNRALQQLSKLEFLRIDNPNLLAYAKATETETTS